VDIAASIIVIVAGIVAVVAVSVWGAQWGSVRRAEIDARVKQDMLARGLSVEEIERLLNLSSAPSFPSSRPSEPALVLATAVESMVETGKDTQEIAAVLDALLRRQGGAEETTRQSALALAPALESMAAAGKDTEELAAVLDTFLRRHDAAQDSSPTQQPTESPRRPSEEFTPFSRPGG
jgi:hypothetical protein